MRQKLDLPNGYALLDPVTGALSATYKNSTAITFIVQYCNKVKLEIDNVILLQVIEQNISFSKTLVLYYGRIAYIRIFAFSQTKSTNVYWTVTQ